MAYEETEYSRLLGAPGSSCPIQRSGAMRSRASFLKSNQVVCKQCESACLVVVQTMPAFPSAEQKKQKTGHKKTESRGLRELGRPIPPARAILCGSKKHR